MIDQTHLPAVSSRSRMGLTNVCERRPGTHLPAPALKTLKHERGAYRDKQFAHLNMHFG